MNWRHIRTIWRKEVLDTIRDRRTLITGVLLPILIIPLVMLGSQALVTSTQREAEVKRTPIIIVGEARAPRMASLIRQSGAFEIIAADDPAGALKDGKVQLVLRVPDGFEQLATAGRTPAEMTVDFEAAKMSASVALQKLRICLEGYNTMAQATRLGLADPGILQAVKITEHNVSTPRQMGGMLLGFSLPFLLAMLGIMGGMYTAIDAVAGEKERKTLETLVITPPTRASLATGKSLAVFTMSVVTVILSVISTYLSFQYGLPLVDKSGTFQMSLGPVGLGMLLLVAVPYVAMLSGVQVALSCFGKSFKETQNYFSLLMFAIMIPGMALVFIDKSFPAWIYAAPLANAVALFKQVITGTWIWRNVIICVATNLVYLTCTIAMAQRMLSNEKLLFKA